LPLAFAAFLQQQLGQLVGDGAGARNYFSSPNVLPGGPGKGQEIQSPVCEKPLVFNRNTSVHKVGRNSGKFGGHIFLAPGVQGAKQQDPVAVLNFPAGRKCQKRFFNWSLPNGGKSNSRKDCESQKDLPVWFQFFCKKTFKFFSPIFS